MNTSKLIAGLLMPAMLSLAAEPVQWSDLPKKIGHGKMRSDGREDREYRVVTKDGAIHKGHAFIFSSVGVKVEASGPFIPREQVAEIRIHRDRKLRDALIAPTSLILTPIVGSDDGFQLLITWPLLIPGIPLAFGVNAAAIPLILPTEGIRRLLPDEVFEVAP
jgi:hypothetical protein